MLIDTGTKSYSNDKILKSYNNHSVFQINNKNLIYNGKGITEFLSHYSINNTNYKIEKDKITFKGITLENIKWSRKIYFFKKNNIIFEDSCFSTRKLITGKFF